MGHHALKHLGDQCAVEPLIRVLEGEEWRVRDNAAEALGQLGDPRAVEPLIKALGTRLATFAGRPWRRGKLGDSRSVDPLIKALGDEQSHIRKTSAEERFWQLGDQNGNR